MVHIRQLMFEQHEPHYNWMSNMNPITTGVWHKWSSWSIRSCSTIGGIHRDDHAINRSYVTHGDKSWAKINEITCNHHKPSISLFIRDTDSIKDNTIHEGDPHEAEHRFNWEKYSPSAGTAGMVLHIYGNFTT